MKFFRINVSGEKFFLSEKNILSDSPNLFTERFKDHFQTQQSCYNKKSKKSIENKNVFKNRMAVDRNPEVFKVIHLYLQGYDMSRVMKDMSATKKQHLLEDAHYYGLRKLQSIVRMNENDAEYYPLVDYSSSEEDTFLEEEEDDDLLSAGNLSYISY